MDKSLSAAVIEPLDTDFNVESGENELSILLFFEDVDVDCVVSTFKGKISSDNKMVLAYFANRNSAGKKNYEIKADPNPDALDVLSSRYYLRHLNAEFVRSNRDLNSYLKRQKKYMFSDFKGVENRR